VKAYLFISQELLRRNWTVEILCGEFVKFRGMSDLAEEQGSYDKHSSSVSSGEIVPLDHSCNLISWIRELKGQNPCIKIREVARYEVPK
jgi:hypothetical protein